MQHVKDALTILATGTVLIGAIVLVLYLTTGIYQ